MSKIIYMTLLSFAVAITVSPLKIEADIRPISHYSDSDLVRYFADVYKVSAQKMDKIITCESNYNDLAHKYTPTGVHKENSWGRSQINLFAHPEVTKEQATDRVFATEYLAKHLALGDVNWTCNK